MTEKTLTLVFKKDSGAAYSFNLAFPLQNPDSNDILALGQALVGGDILAFKDGTKLVSLEKAYIRETSKEDIELV